MLARTRYLTEVPELSALGADEVVAEEFETSLEIAGRTLRRLGFSLPWVEAETDEIRRSRHDAFGGSARRRRCPRRCARRSARPASRSCRSERTGLRPAASLEELALRSRGGASVLAVVRAGEATVSPAGDFMLAGGDQLLLLGGEPAVERSLEILRG